MSTPSILQPFNTTNYDFNFNNDNTRIVCHHDYGKSSFKIMCEIEDTDLKTVKNAITRIKKAISEAKKEHPKLHGCTTYLDTINI
jgi:hypothetical protein